MSKIEMLEEENEKLKKEIEQLSYSNILLHNNSVSISKILEQTIDENNTVKVCVDIKDQVINSLNNNINRLKENNDKLESEVYRLINKSGFLEAGSEDDKYKIRTLECEKKMLEDRLEIEEKLHQIVLEKTINEYEDKIDKLKINVKCENPEEPFLSYTDNEILNLEDIINVKEDVIIDLNAKIDKLEKENKYIKDKASKILLFTCKECVKK